MVNLQKIKNCNSYYLEYSQITICTNYHKNNDNTIFLKKGKNIQAISLIIEDYEFKNLLNLQI